MMAVHPATRNLCQPLPLWTTAGSAKSRIGTRRDFRIRGKRRCSALDVTTLPSIVSEYHRRLSSSFGSRRLRPLSSPACPQVIVYVNGAGLRRSRATTATRRGSRSPRSPGGLDGRRRQSRHTLTTRLTLTKGATQASARRAPCTAPPRAESRPGPQQDRTHAAMAWRRQPDAHPARRSSARQRWWMGRERSVCGGGLNTGVHATPLEEEQPWR
jgi:hypothetical protein